MVDLIQRNNDIIFGKEDLEHLYTFKNFPVFMGCTEQEKNKDIFADMSYWISKGSGCIQLNPLLPLEVVYPESHGSGVVGSSWNKHHKELSKFIMKFSPTSILEIGGGHGILAKNCLEKKDLNWTIVEPNPSISKNKKINVIKGFFEENFKLDFCVDTIVHSHLIEHIYDPNKFLKNLSSFLKVDQLVIFSVPNLLVMLEKKFTNCLNFEHTLYLNGEYIKFLFASNNFELIEEKNFLEDHSIFYCFKKVKGTKSFKLPYDSYRRNKNSYLEYIKHHEVWAKSINEKIKNYSGDVFLFGAHAQSQYMLNFGIKVSLIKNILDNDINKQNKRLYGTELKVISPKKIKKSKNPVVILRAGTFQNEIRKQLIEINSEVNILE